MSGRRTADGGRQKQAVGSHLLSSVVGRRSSFLRALSLGQASYYVLTGVWPIVSLRTFMKVTGPKTDTWLVKTVGVLVAIVGVVVGLAGWRSRVTPEIHLLAAGSAAGLALVDVVYVTKRRIAPIYLLDAVAEAGLIGGWLYLLSNGQD